MSFSLAAAALAAIAAATPPLPPDYPLQKAPPACPAWLSVWTMNGTLDAGDDWDAVLLEIRGERARVTEVAIRSAVPRLPVAEADWFTPDGLDAEAYAFSVGTRAYSGKALDDLCNALAKGGLGAVLSRASAEMKAVDGSLVIANKQALSLLDDRDGHVGAFARPGDPRPPERLPPIPYDEAVKPPPGTIAQPGLAATSTDEIDRRNVTAKTPDPENPIPADRLAQDDRERVALDSARDVLARQARAIHETAGDLEDIPALRRAFDHLRELDPTALPKNLPSEFVLATIGAPKNYVTALALELLGDDAGADRLKALRWLGDEPSTSAVEDLLAVLRKRPDIKIVQREQALAFRALLKASPDQARMQALRALTGPRTVVRAAMGVFYFTEPSLRRELSTVDFSNPDKVRGMAARIRSHLTVNAKDPELKKAAAGVQNPY